MLFLGGDCLTTSPSCISMQRNNSSGDLEEKHKANINFMRKIPPGNLLLF